MRLPFFVLAVAAVAYAKHHHKHRVPIIDLSGAEQLTATIREDENVLNTVPDLAIITETGPICSYVFTSESGDVPFEAEVVDKYSGAAVIRVKDASNLDCKKDSYKFTVHAVRCDDESARSEGVTLKISVKDTNNHAPEFDQPWYTFSVDEGKIYNEIASLSATDADCGHPFGEICEYEITNGLEDFPFTISNQGVLSNTRPLNYSSTKSYILTVVAHDCGMRKSKSALVTINLKEACVEGVGNLPERVNYSPGSGGKTLFPDIQLHSCHTESECEVDSVSAVVELKAGHVTNGCSRETLFTNESIKNCGLNPALVSLLPEVDEPIVEEDRNDVTDKGEKYLFDGHTNAIIVPEKAIKGLISDKFALSFTMKHARGSKEQENNKQNILCESDDFNMNRHHFSVYIRHCKLEVVLRRESGAAAEFRAAEWRWGVPEVCDGNWHSYSLLFNGVDDVNLMIDGRGFGHDERNPEILDDWPLHKTKQTKTRVVIGACWHARQSAMAQYFHGHISSVYLLNNAAESQEAIACAHRCPEQLQFSGSDELKEGETATLNPEQSTVTLNASTIKDVSRMLQRVAYVNSLETPVPGHRQIHLTSKIQCTKGKKIELPSQKTYVFVQKQVEPVLSISGAAMVTTDQHAVKVGTAMLPDIKILVSQNGPNGEVVDVTGGQVLDYCKVHLKPSRDMDLEYFSSPASLIASMKIDFEHDKQGILLRGEEKVKNYGDVLSKIHYFNTRPESYSKRIYSVQCSMMKGRVMSNEFIVTMTIEPSRVILPTEDTTESPIDVLEKVHFEPAFDQLGSSRLQNILEMDLPRPKALLSHHGYDMGQGAIAGGAVAVVVVVCVGFLLVLLVIGVLKMRDTPVPRKNRKQRKPEPGMQWDDEGMNITVNPLDDVEKNIGEEYSEDEESTDGDESECSFHDEEDEVSEDEEGEPEILPHLEGRQPGLEWDDETMTGGSKSYRV